MADFSNIDVVVLAGGRGERIKALYPNTPKPMIPVRGRPFLYWLTRYLAGFGLRRFIYSTGYRGEQIEAWCQEPLLAGLDRLTCPEPMPLGTGGGLLNCLPLCRDWVLVANGDGLCLGGVPELLSLTSTGAAGGLIGVHVEDAARFGSLQFSAGNRLQSLREKVGGSGSVNGGLYLFSKATLESISGPGFASLEVDLLPRLLELGADLRVVTHKGALFIDIGTPDSLHLAEGFVDKIRDLLPPERLEPGGEADASSHAAADGFSFWPN